MGLDQYAGMIEEQKSEHFKNEDGSYDTWEMAVPFEWRKHARLQEFMNRLYMERNKIGSKWEQSQIDEDGKAWITPISWSSIELSSEDIDSLEKAIDNGYSDYFCDGGFFWGHQSQEEMAKEYKDRDKEFVKFAREALSKGEKVFYQCSW